MLRSATMGLSGVDNEDFDFNDGFFCRGLMGGLLNASDDFTVGLVGLNGLVVFVEVITST